MYRFQKRSAFVLAAAVLILLLTTGCRADSIAEDSVTPSVDSRLVYASSDGLYERDLSGKAGEAGGEARMIHEGKSLSQPIFSQDGTRLLFQQTLDQTPEEKTGTYRRVLYAHDFESGQTIKVLDDPVSYCAGPGGSFMIAAEAGQVLKVELTLQEREGGPSLVPEMEDITPAVETVPDKDSITAVLYENLKPSPDLKYLAYSVTIHDGYIIAENWEGGHYSGAYSGGLYLLDLETGETSLVVEPIRSFEAEDGMGNDPEPGPWSRDGKVLCVWDKPQSGSMTADGVSCFFYRADTGQKTEYGVAALSYTGHRKAVLAYDENISFSEAGTAAVLSGMGREMFYGKKIDLITDYSGALAGFREIKGISENGLIPAMPQLSADGKTLYFAAINKDDVKGYEEGNWTSEEYQNIWPLKRQLYSVELEDAGEIKAGKITQITSDPDYRCESPTLLKNEEYLVFGRASAEDYDGKMEIWMADLSSGKEIKLAEWTESDDADVWAADRYDDYYGRGSWNGIFAIYDATK